MAKLRFARIKPKQAAGGLYAYIEDGQNERPVAEVYEYKSGTCKVFAAQGFQELLTVVPSLDEAKAFVRSHAGNVG